VGRVLSRPIGSGEGGPLKELLREIKGRDIRVGQA